MKIRVKESRSQKLQSVQPTSPNLEHFENSFEYYRQPFKPKMNYFRVLQKKSQPNKEQSNHTSSCRIRQFLMFQNNNNETLNNLPSLTITINTQPSRSKTLLIKNKKPSMQQRYKQIMEYKVEDSFTELRKLLSRQKKSSSLGRRVQFQQL